MITQKLKGKKALVTAGAQGIGLEISRHLLDAGCHVAVHYFSSDAAAKELVKTYAPGGQKVIPLQADLTDPQAAKNLVNEAADALDGIDILINNAGSLVERRSLDECDADFVHQLINLNLESAIQVTRACAPYLRKSTTASIVNLASLAGRKGGHTGSLIYSTAKGGLITLTRALANELGGEGIRVNAVAPGLILGTSFHNTHTTEASANETIAGIPIRQAGTPADVARAVCFLASEYDGFIHGVTLDINGGCYAS
ncbi:MAG: SDR family NAD(P)-dependent oxidoreductase [Opitutaceae bacterium]